MVDFESSKEQIANLVDEFKANEHYFKSVSFDEENTKINFINKFFIALGWDVYNDAGVAPQYKDVEFEDTVLVSGKPKNPDYSFRVGGTRKFFVEAKAPHVNVENSKEYAFQLKRYTWSGKLSVGLLTDFEELSIYVPKSAPKLSHHPKTDRIKYYKYTDYVENWEEIYNIYSKEAVLSGKFDNYFSDKDLDGKNPTSSVDSEFLKTIEEWRLILARNIALRNKELEVEELNYAVQLIIDRIIFLRIAEDRGIERYGKLKKLLDLAENNIDKCPVYEGFIELCKKADAKYNSGLFHFTEEEDITLDADILTPTLHVDDGTLKKIIKGLYYPDCPYEFSMISTEILGNIYEQFLGKVIRLTDAHHAKVEDKPEVKKAGGVFYTPQYIVDYIVENTIGELLKGKTPNKVSELRIVDPACGSGSFLLGAYQKLLDWHTDYYSNLEQPPKNVIYTDKKGIKRLTIQEKKRILLNNIYGVDIDSQAVEVTKLSLLLKVLEDENKDVLEQQQKLIQERALPYLGNNIRCGNSLIGTDILEEDDLTDEDISIINPFDWEDEFSEIFENGGFDAVIGNPPYVGEKGNKENFRFIKKTTWGKKFYKRKMDLFYFFFHRSLDILSNNGYFGMITTNYFVTADGGIKLRTDIKKRASLLKLVNLNELTIFENAKGQHNLITFFKKSDSESNNYVETIFVNKNGKSNKNIFNHVVSGEDEEVIYSKIKENEIFDTNQNYIRIPRVSNDFNEIFDKIKYNSKFLGEIKNVSQGIISGADKVTQRHLNNLNLKEINKNEGVYVLSKEEVKLLNLNNEELSLLKPFFKNSDIDKFYSKVDPDKFLIYLTRDLKINDFPNIKEHVIKYSKIIKNRSQDRGEMKAALKLGKWWVVFAARKDTDFDHEKIVAPQRSLRNTFGYNEIPWYASADVYFITNKEDYMDISLKYVLSLLNSNLYYFWLVNKGKTKGKQLELYYTPLTEIPIKIINMESQKPFIDLADKMLDLTNQLQNVKTPKQKGLLEKQIKVTDKKINQLVYELYDLSGEEINIVEDILK